MKDDDDVRRNAEKFAVSCVWDQMLCDEIKKNNNND